MASLATVSELKQWMGHPDSPSTSDPLLAACLNTAERSLADLCGRPGDTPWTTTTRTEHLDGNLSNGVLLTYTPVTAVSAVTIVTGADSSGTETGDSVAVTRLAVDGYPIGGTFSALVGLLHFRTTGRDRILGFEWGEPIGYLSTDPGPAFSAGHNRVKVAYTGGVSATVIPAQLKQAVIESAEALFRRSGASTGGNSPSEAFARQTFDVSNDRLMGLVSAYMRRRF